MDFKKLSLNVRNNNIENIAVVLNTLDAVIFPNLTVLLKEDLERFELINRIQTESEVTTITKDAVYKFCINQENK